VLRDGDTDERTVEEGLLGVERDELEAHGIDLEGLEQNGAGAKRRKMGVGLQDVDGDKG
jgi:hypothetical protein